VTLAQGEMLSERAVVMCQCEGGGLGVWCRVEWVLYREQKEWNRRVRERDDDDDDNDDDDNNNNNNNSDNT